MSTIKGKQNALARSYRRTHKGGKLELSAHAHYEHQIMVPHEGVAQIIVEGEGSYFLSRGQGMFVAAGRAHEGAFSGVLALDNLYLHPGVCDQTLRDNSFVFRISELFLAVWSTFQSKTSWHEKNPEFDALCLLLGKEMIASREHEAFLPIPEHELLKPLALRLKENPAAFACIDDIAVSLKISSRHLRRLFQNSCGITLSQWLTRARIMLAKEMLAQQWSISEVALELGFQEFGSFSRFFKRATGMSARTWTKKFVR